MTLYISSHILVNIGSGNGLPSVRLQMPWYLTVLNHQQALYPQYKYLFSTKHVWIIMVLNMTHDTSQVNSFGTETGIFHKGLVNTMAADGLAPYVTRSSAAMILIMQDKHIHVFHKEGFQLPLPPNCWKMRGKCTYNFKSSEKNFSMTSVNP